MSDLMNLEQYGAIRKTEDGRVSVYDLIQVVGGKKSPREVWKRLTEEYSEVVTKCDSFRFPGRGQQDTPVTDREGALYIIGLLPGVVGKTYRSAAVKLVLQYMDTPEDLAVELVRKLTTREQIEKVEVEVRKKYLETYHPLMDAIKERANEEVVYKIVNSTNTKAVTGKTPSMVVSERGGKTAREFLTIRELGHMKTLQDLQEGALRKRNVQGREAVVETVSEVADKFKALLEEYL